MTSSALPEMITSEVDILAYLRSGCKPRADWRIGTEHEKFAFDSKTFRPVAYENAEPNLADFLARMCAQMSGCQRHEEDGKLIGLASSYGSISLEPGGQVEFSSRAVKDLHQACSDMHDYLRRALAVAQELGFGFLGLGFLPQWSRDDIPWMPKRRYAIMRKQMLEKGSLGIDMMKRTCTVQVNLDFDSEDMMVQCLRIGLALQPFVVALFANSPFREGDVNGFLSYRSHVWTDTDNERCGILPFVFDEHFGFRHYIDYLLDVPMYFIRRHGVYYDMRGRSFRDFMAGKLVGFESVYPTLEDLKDHMSTIFTEVRLKTFIEMRGADGGSLRCLCALAAFWVGLLYDDDIRAECWQRVKGWSRQRHHELRHRIPREGLKMRLGTETVADAAAQFLELAKQGLKKRRCYNTMNQDESIFLQPLFEQIESGMTPAEYAIQFWRDHNKDMALLYRHFAY